MKTDIALLALRIYGGLYMLLGHGLPKISRLSADPIQFADPLGLGPALSLYFAVFAEVVCALFVTLGLLTRWASIPLAATMAVAAFIVHAADPWSRKELAISYLCVYVALYFLGGGRFGLDPYLRRYRA